MKIFFFLPAFINSRFIYGTVGDTSDAGSPPSNVDIHPRIIGGTQISINNAPFIVGLTIRSGLSTEMCGASIISSKYIVTAAHCIDGKAASQVSVRIGSSRFDSGGRVVGVNNIFTDNYRPSTVENDIAILELDSEISSSTDPNAQIIPFGSGNPPSGSTCYTAGWGLTSNGGSSSSRLMRVQLNIWGTSACRMVWGQSVSGSKQICALGDRYFGDLYKDSCAGDSGGPLYCTYKGETALYGIVSYGPQECGTDGVPGVYTRPSYYKSGIEDITGPLEDSEIPDNNGIPDSSVSLKSTAAAITLIYYVLAILF
ncbi:unnamed protein product [Oikopleura dioica]|uniref:Peptidase S1 domain-containing protein n=1 Tax=Oikopleura dioica TaxID=34765 RepID=E4XQT4_OIKDI|nr:unnamed protein product [Oikopleura dioica]